MGSYPALDVRYGSTPDAGLLQDLLYAELDSFAPVGIHELETADGWRVFFRRAEQRDRARAALAEAFRNRLLDLCSVDVDDKDWARRSQAALTAVQVGRITIAPPWDAMESLIPDPDTILIVIEPSMGFGTGHHATTRLCLALLQELDVRGKRVIDVGTGSGILALAAWKLGASRVTALDHDPDALQNARENIERNGGTAAIEVVEADVSGGRVNPGSVVLANLTGSVLQRHATGLIQLAGGDGVLVVSGFSPAEVEGIAGAFGLAGRIACGKEVVPLRIVRDGEWAAAVIG